MINTESSPMKMTDHRSELLSTIIDKERKSRNLTPLLPQQIILVGSNPLPCYIAALMLSKFRIVLVCTDDTMHIGQTIQQMLLERGVACDNPVRIDRPSSSDHIMNTVKSIRDLSKCGLHYTGGKKTMSVHAYRAWIDVAKDVTQASYVDAQRMKLAFDGTQYEVEMRSQPVIGIDDLFRLHGIRPHSKSAHKSAPPIANLSAQALKSEIAHGAGYLGNLPSRGPEQGRTSFPIDLKTFFDTHYQRTSDTYSFDQFCCDFLGYPDRPVETVPGKKKTEKIERWLRGEWLEEYVWGQLSSIAGKAGITDIVYDINMLTRADAQFQVDVACMRGHTLIVFSCTTEAQHKSILKHKVFEAQIRAKQLGGDHARYALVSLAHRGLAADTEKEIKQTWDGDDHFRIFDQTDLSGNFAEALTEWIENI